MHEVPLEGGNVSLGVVRVGETVRRPVGDSTPAVHALLRHLEAVKFDAAPRVLGIDDRGREILTYCEGVSLYLEAPSILDSVESVAKAGGLVAQLHDAVQLFEAPPHSRWFPGATDPVNAATVIHGDLAPWNIIVNGDDWKLIDWDSAGPGRLEWEAAYSLHTFARLWPDSDASDAQTVARIRAFGDGAKLASRELIDVLRLVPARTAGIAEMIDRLASYGHPAFALHQKEGHPQAWRAASAHVRSRLPAWVRQLKQ